MTIWPDIAKTCTNVFKEFERHFNTSFFTFGENDTIASKNGIPWRDEAKWPLS